MEKIIVRRGDIFMAELPCNNINNSLLAGRHPVLVMSCQASNKFSDLVTIIPLTSTIRDNPSNVIIEGFGLKNKSCLLANQTQTINKNLLLSKICFISTQKMQEVERVLMEQLGIKNNWGDLKVYQVYEKSRMEIRLAKCQEDWDLLEKLTDKYIKSLYEMNYILDNNVNQELEWAYFYLSLVKKNANEFHEAYDIAQKALSLSTQRNSDYYYSMWLLGCICIELSGKFALEGVNAFEKCKDYYHEIGDKKYEIIAIFNKARLLKDILGMQECIQNYKNTKFKPTLCNFGDMDKDSVLESMERDLDNSL